MSASAGDPVQSPAAMWTEHDELRLLKAVLEIAVEPVESFDPAVSLFARVGKSLGRSLPRAEILAKVKELRRRYEERCYKIRVCENGGGDCDEVFVISDRVWGIGKKKEKKQKKGKKWKRKKEEEVHIDKLTNVGSRKFKNKSHPRKHFSVIISSSWGKRCHLESCQNQPTSQNSFCSSTSSSILTENVDLMELRKGSELILTALNDVSEKNEELSEKSNQNQELMDKSNRIVPQPFIHGLGSPMHADEANGEILLAESFCRVAEKRLRLALEACTEGKARAWASSAFNLSYDEDSPLSSTNESDYDLTRHENPKIQNTVFQNLELDTECFPSLMDIDDPTNLIFDSESNYLLGSSLA